MTDKAIFLGMSGARSSMNKLAIMTNNLANVNTTGYRADFQTVQQNHVGDDSETSTRVFSNINSTYTDFHPGPIINTGRDLDLAISGKGFIAVQGKDGQEAYTRAGNLEIVNGNLTTRSGDLVMGNSGVIVIPPAKRLEIGVDGTVSVMLINTHEMEPIDKIKLTDPNVEQLTKGEDGLFYMQNGVIAPLSTSIKLVHAALESSNVNAVETLANLVDISRSFDVHTNFMKTMQDNASKENQILDMQQ
jgi:flagellar basal-body rod protein FlgF